MIKKTPIYDFYRVVNCVLWIVSESIPKAILFYFCLVKILITQRRKGFIPLNPTRRSLPLLLSHRVRPVMLRAFAQIATRFSVIFITITGFANSKLCASASLRDVRHIMGLVKI